MDGRKTMLVVRMRLTMGNGFPQGMRPITSSDEVEEAIDDGSPRSHRIMANGRYINTVDRLVTLVHEGAFDTTEALADHLVDSLRSLCPDDQVWQQVRSRVRVFCPDGARNEQLAGRIAAETFENMHFILRCSAHAAQGALKARSSNHSGRRCLFVLAQSRDDLMSMEFGHVSGLAGSGHF